MKDECEYNGCPKRGYRHLMRHYFCREHRWRILSEAEQADTDDLWQFIDDRVTELEDDR